MVLMGDAAHTTHFAIGSGTKLAIQDAMALVHARVARVVFVDTDQHEARGRAKGVSTGASTGPPPGSTGRSHR